MAEAEISIENASENVLSAMLNSLIDEIEVIPNDEEGGDDEEFHQNDIPADSSPNSTKFGFGADLEVNTDGSIKYPEVILTRDMIRTGLSNMTRTLDTFEFAYSRYDGRNKNLTNIDILGEYVHLRVIDLSGNRIDSFKALAPIKHLLVLVVAENLMQTFEDVPELPFLQALNAKGNFLTSVEGLFKNSLSYLQLSSNEFEKLDKFNAETFPCLTILELRGNKLESLEGLEIPTLLRLFVASNELTSLKGLESCAKLTHLHARENKISKLTDFPNLPNLEYVNLRSNEVRRYSETHQLGNSPNIRTLIMMGNPISKQGNYKIEMIATNMNLKRLDKEPITEIELVEGRQLRTGRDKGVYPEVQDDGEATPPPLDVIEGEEGQDEGNPKEAEGEQSGADVE